MSELIRPAQGHTETRPQFKPHMRPEKCGAKPATPGMVGQHIIHYTHAAPVSNEGSHRAPDMREY